MTSVSSMVKLINPIRYMNSEISTLYSIAHELLYLGMDGSPIYSDNFSRLNREVYHQANNLYSHHGSTPEEEASLCLSLLMAYNATFYDDGDKQERIQCILDRCWVVLDKLPASLLKLRLLTACYGEVSDEPLADEARSIITSWDSASLTPEQQEVVKEFQNVVDTPYSWEEV